jgi:hypothetical protein
MDKNERPGCSLYRTDELSRYLVGGLSPKKRKRLEQHLESCVHCRQQVRELIAVQTVLRRAPDVAPPQSFALSDADTRLPRRRLWYPVLRVTTMAAATLVLILLLGGVLQPDLVRVDTPTPRLVGVKATPLIAPTPLPVAIAPAKTSRPRPTPANAAPSIEGAPATKAPAYPQPAESRPHIDSTIDRPAGAAPADAAAPQTTTLWSAIHLGGLVVLGVLAGLTWLAYRRERVFF